jgi:hypothetical protein
MARVLAIAPELMFASKIEATLGTAGHDVTVVSWVEGPLPGDPEVLIVDLDNTDWSRGLPTGAPKLGFYSHVDVETRRKAEDSGFDLVVPRSRMAREMPALVDSLLQRPA